MRIYDLEAAIIRSTATPGQIREYVRRVDRRLYASPCLHRHYDCALRDGGPCSDEALASLEVTA